MHSFINRLSDDVLGLIFSLAIARDRAKPNLHVSYTWSYTELLQLAASSVCRRWRNLITSSPLLWRNIFLPCALESSSTRAIPAIVKLFFERSANLLVELHLLQTCDPNRTYSTPDVNHFASIIERRSSRLRAMTIPGTLYASLFVCAGSRPSSDNATFSNLQHLCVFLDDGEPCSMAHDIGKPYMMWDPQHYPIASIQSLDFREYCFACTPIFYTPFPALTYLRLEPVMPTHATLECIFANAPLLKTLIIALEGSPFPEQYQSIPSPIARTESLTAPMSLQNVAIHFRLPQGIYCRCALAHIHIPNLQYLEIGGCIDISQTHCVEVLSHLADSPALCKVKCHVDYLPSPRWLPPAMNTDWVRIFSEDIISRTVDVEIIWLKSPRWILPGFIPSICCAPRVKSVVLRTTATFIQKHLIEEGLLLSPIISESEIPKQAAPAVFRLEGLHWTEATECKDRLLKTLKTALGFERISVESPDVRVEAEGDLLDEVTVQRSHGHAWNYINRVP